MPTPRKPTTVPPPVASGTDMGDTELALRRQMSRLQRQLSDAQRELANKDEELAATVEKRVEVAKQYDESLTRLRDAQSELDDLKDYKSLVVGIEQRLQDAVAAADELNHQLERERAERAAIATQLEAVNASFEKARQTWKDESALSDQHHAVELEKFEQQRKSAVEAAEAAMSAAIERQQEAQKAELEELRAAHERELAATRGELEPKVAEARNLAAEIERLTSEIAAVRAESMRELAERVEHYKWEQQQAAEGHAAELAAAERKAESDKAGLEQKLAELTDTLGLTERNGLLREQLWEQTTATLRESQKKLQQELAEAKEKFAQADANKLSFEQRLTTTLSQLEELTASQRDLEKRVEAAETEARRNALDRQRFAAYLEEGLAMVGALPPRGDAGPPPPSDSADEIEPPDRDSAPEMTVEPGTEVTAEPAGEPDALPSPPDPHADPTRA